MAQVVGRFAPSPTGSLHLGSLVAATASYLNAKQQHGKWLVRIDDLDKARVVNNSDKEILTVLEAFGFEWDTVIYQSQRLSYYHHALSQLKNNNHLYACHCTRKDLKTRNAKFPLYDGYCRDKNYLILHSDALRLKTPLESTTPWLWHDLIEGEQQIYWQKDVDDFIVKRRDGVIAYHLATAVDDVDFGITEVIRGADLLSSTAPQQFIQHLLNKKPPHYGHHKLIYDEQTGIKLSKASHAAALDSYLAKKLLIQVLIFLEMTPPSDLESESLKQIWQWAIVHWKLDALKSI